jgi:hypothetical protein
MHCALKMHTKTQSLFKTLECPRLLCHRTCFGHILDHLQGMFLVQCYIPLVASSQFYLGMWPYLLSVLLSCMPICCRSCCLLNKTNSREVHMTTTQREDTATYPSKTVTKQQAECSIVQGTSPEDGQVCDRNM